MSLTKRQKIYINYVKRPIGFLGALVALIIFSPIMLILMAVLYFANKGAGVFFLQARPGKNAVIFKAIKFKTMTDERDSEGNLLPDGERITPVGHFIRSTSLDELPQLINILKGEMAFIGPRPLLISYLPLYTQEQMHRHDVLPGLSGLAQINGRNNIPWEKKFELDLYYIDHIGPLMDMKIFLKTIVKVFMRSDINTSSGKSATMELFTGTNNKKNENMKDIAILGMGGLGREILSLIKEINKVENKWNIIGFFDDGYSPGYECHGLKNHGGINLLNSWDRPLALVIAIGSPNTKKSIYNKIINKNIYYPTLIHPCAVIADPDSVRIGEGSLICANNMITCDIVIGKFVLLNLSCTLGHDTIIKDFCAFMPTCNISGECVIEEGTYCGTGVKIINKITIGRDTIVGAGSVVVRSLPSGCTAVGSPAKPIKFANPSL